MLEFNKNIEIEFRTIARVKTNLTCRDTLWWKLMDMFFVIDKSCADFDKLPSIKISYSKNWYRCISDRFLGYESKYKNVIFTIYGKSQNCYISFNLKELVEFMLFCDDVRLNEWQGEYYEIFQDYAYLLYNEITYTRKRKKDFKVEKFEPVEKTRLRMLEILSLYLELKTKQLKNNNHGE